MKKTKPQKIQDNETPFDGRETLGEWKSGKPWNAVTFDLSGKPITSYKNGVQHADPIKQATLIKLIYTLDSQG
jgi:hypothetical protein